jgi:outer membrane protein TolC
MIFSKRTRIRILVVLTLFSSPMTTSLSALDAEITPLRAEELIPELRSILDSAKDHAPLLVEEGFIREEGQQRLKQAKASYYPSIDLSADLGIRQQYRTGAEDDTNFGLNFSARLSRPIYHWGALEARIEQARIDNDSDTLNYLENVRAIQRQIRADYLTLLLNKILLRNENIRRTQLNEELEKLELDFESGTISEIDYQSTQLNLQDALLNISKLERNQQRISSTFKETAGWDQPILAATGIPPFEIDELKKWHSTQTDATDPLWVDAHRDAQLIMNELLRENETLTIIKAQQRPLVNFTASASQNQTNTATANNVDTLSLFAGITVRWNIFDGWLTKHERVESKLKHRRLESKLERIKTELKLEKSRMLDLIHHQMQSADHLERRHELELKRFANTRADHAAGRLTQADLRSTELSLNDLELELMTARANLLMQVSDYYDLTQAHQTETTVSR